MLRERLQDRKTYEAVIGRMSRFLLALPRSHVRIRDPLSRVFTESEARELRFRPAGWATEGATYAPYLPKWLEDAQGPDGYRVVIATAALNAVNMVCRLMRKGAYRFSRLRASATVKRVSERYEETPGRSRLHLTEYHGLSPGEKAQYRVMVRTTFPDALVLGALAAALTEAYPDTYFLPECCGYLPGRGQKEAVRQVVGRLRSGYNVVLRADVVSFNETVPQERLLSLIRRRLLQSGWSPEDTGFFERTVHGFFSRVDEVFRTPGVGIGMGTSLTPIFTNVYLNQLDRFLKGQDIPFSRLGDDLALFFTDPSAAVGARGELAAFVSAYLRQEMSEAKSKVSTLGPSRAPGARDEDGFDFGAYHFRLEADGRPSIRIKDATVGKIRRRIKLLTRLPRKTGADPESPAPPDRRAYLVRAVEKLSRLLGFVPGDKRAGGRVQTDFLMTGWPAAFLNDAASYEIRGQFKDLDRYIVYRLRRIAVELGLDGADKARFRRSLRDMGLRTFIDAWNRHPRPNRY